MSTTPKPLYTPESVDEALLVLDSVANTPDQSDWTLYQVIDMAAQKLRPEPAPDHDAEALEQLARKHPIDLPWMQEDGVNAIREAQGFPPIIAIATPSAGGQRNCLNSDMPCEGCQKGGEAK